MLDLPGRAGVLCHAMPRLTMPYLTVPYLTMPCLTMPYLTTPYLAVPRCAVLYRAVPCCAVPEGCSRRAAQQGAALLVSILPRSPAGNYREIKNVSKSNFSSSQVWAETCDPVFTETTEPSLQLARGVESVGCCMQAAPHSPAPRHPRRGAGAARLHPQPPLPLPLRATGPSPPMVAPSRLQRAAKEARSWCKRHARCSEFVPFPGS